MIHTRLKEWHPESRLLCSVDPVTLTGLAIGALGGLGAGAASGAIGGGSSTPPAAAAGPTAPPPAAPPEASPQGSKATPKPQTPTFLGTATTPSTSTGSGGKTLLGQ